MGIITGQVRCSGRMHRISIPTKGPIKLHNHTRAELVAERIMIALGGQPCRCIQVLNAWRTRDKTKIPSWATELFDRLRAPININRILLRKLLWRTDPLTTPMRERVQRRLSKLMISSIRSCTYPAIDIISICAVALSLPPDAIPMVAKIKNVTHVQLGLLRWYNEVYKKGLAIVDGVFVLDVLSETETGYKVLAVCQNTQRTVMAACVQVTTDSAGQKTLEFQQKHAKQAKISK